VNLLRIRGLDALPEIIGQHSKEIETAKRTLPITMTVGKEDLLVVAAPLLLLLLRLLQGIGLGGEWGGAVIMAFEYAPHDKRGFYTCFPQIGLAVGLSLSTAVVALLTYTLSDEAFLFWGWRAAFLFSIVLVGVGLFVRLSSRDARIRAPKETQTIARARWRDPRDYRTLSCSAGVAYRRRRLQRLRGIYHRVSVGRSRNQTSVLTATQSARWCSS
jgi:MFS family permease